MVYQLNGLQDGLTTICEQNGRHSSMIMDISLLKMKKSTAKILPESTKETALLLVTGKATVKWLNHSVVMERTSEFDENPWCLHIPRDINVEIDALADSEFVIQSTDNTNTFDAILYAPADCRCEYFGDGQWNGTARRTVRTVFDYSNAPYSNMVMGEVITYPGKWSSYPPHYHPQPEVYYYRFDKPQGFGMCLNGKDAFMITHNSYAVIEGGSVHPQTAAPGYAMYYCWMIRHLENNPWKDRILDEKHAWLCGADCRIMPEK